MFERFTERSRQAVVAAQESARERDHDRITTMHLVVGLFREEHGVAAKVLTGPLGVAVSEAEELLGEALEVEPIPEGVTSGGLPFTAAAKAGLERALREALGLGHNYIGTEHLLLGLESLGDSPAGQWLWGVSDAGGLSVRDEVMRALHGRDSRAVEAERQARLKPERLRADIEANRHAHAELVREVDRLGEAFTGLTQYAAKHGVINVPDWVWATWMDPTLPRDRGRRLVMDAINATLDVVGAVLQPDDLDGIVKAVLDENPDVAA